MSKVIPAIIVVGALTAVPLASSKITESRFSDMITELNSFDPNTQVYVTNYDGGYLASTATSEVVVNIEGETLPFTLQHTISHLPSITGSIATITTTVQLNALPQDVRDDLFPSGTPITVHSDISLFGSNTHELLTSPINVDEGIFSINVSSGSGKFAITKDSVDGSFTLPSVISTFNGVNLVLTGLEFTTDMVRKTGDQWVGSGSSSIGKLNLSESKERVAVDNIRASFESSITGKNDLMRVSSTLSFGKVDIAMFILGQPISFGGMTFESSMKNFDMPTYTALVEALYLQRFNPKDRYVQAEVMRLSRQLVASKPEMAIDSFTIDHGDSSTSLFASIAYVGTDNPSMGDKAFVESRSMSDVDAKADISIPENTLRDLGIAFIKDPAQLDQLIDGLVKDGFVQPHKGALISSIRLSGGKLLINSKDKSQLLPK